MTAALEGGEWSAARPGRTLPIVQEAGRAENLVPTGIRSRTVQPVVSCYTDWATWPTVVEVVVSIIIIIIIIIIFSLRDGLRKHIFCPPFAGFGFWKMYCCHVILYSVTQIYDDFEATGCTHPQGALRSGHYYKYWNIEVFYRKFKNANCIESPFSLLLHKIITYLFFLSFHHALSALAFTSCSYKHIASYACAFDTQLAPFSPLFLNCKSTEAINNVLITWRGHKSK